MPFIVAVQGGRRPYEGGRRAGGPPAVCARCCAAIWRCVMFTPCSLNPEMVPPGSGASLELPPVPPRCRSPWTMSPPPSAPAAPMIAAPAIPGAPMPAPCSAPSAAPRASRALIAAAPRTLPALWAAACPAVCARLPTAWRTAPGGGVVALVHRCKRRLRPRSKRRRRIRGICHRRASWGWLRWPWWTGVRTNSVPLRSKGCRLICRGHCHATRTWGWRRGGLKVNQRGWWRRRRRCGAYAFRLQA